MILFTYQKKSCFGNGAAFFILQIDDYCLMNFLVPAMLLSLIKVTK